ncbi:dynein axonemal heavy chain 17-like [Xyrichtys novacula]|uniref:Dynein axonemal heavy chain 17-like n=1 Tax=Xyrichtys novacula TaxID=13765 RepID=A0AAV1GGK5_XYRNO|nr:dynein axonemal heavy chain 17-like [Xyrichtys novacula]
MEEKDERVDLIQRFTVNSLRLDPDSWRDFVLEEENQVVFTGFFKSKDFKTMFINRDSEGRLKVSFQFPENVQTKVICVSKTVREALSEENIRDSLTVQEIHGEDAMTVTASVCQQVTCPLLGSLAEQQPISWAAGEGDESQTIMERQKTATQVMRAQIEGRIFLPHPAALQDASYYDNCVGGELSPACDTTIVEWAEFVSEFLKENSSEVVLKGLKPFPSEEFNFWMKRRNNLRFLQEQLQSSRAQQVAAVVQQVDSVLWFTLQDIYRDVEESLREAEEVSQALRPLQETLEQVEQVEYQQLDLIVEAVIERVHQVQIQSQFYRNPDTLLVLLTQICNLFIQRSRDFLRREEVMRGLVSNPGQVLDVRQVIQTLQTLRKAFTEIQNQEQDGVTLSSDSHPADFMDLENVLIHLHKIKEVVFVTLQLSPLDQVVLSGANGSMFTVQVQDLYQDFLHHLKVLSESHCDPTDPEDQNLQIHVDQFLVQVSDQATRLVSLLSRGLEDCCESSSVVQLVQMFWFLLDRPLIRDLLPSLLVRVEVLVLEELDQIEQLFQSQRGDPEVFRGSRSRSSTVAQICWTHQLERRTEEVLKNYRTIQNL